MASLAALDHRCFLARVLNERCFLAGRVPLRPMPLSEPANSKSDEPREDAPARA